MVYTFWLLLSVHYYCRLVKGQLQPKSGGAAAPPAPRFLRACISLVIVSFLFLFKLSIIPNYRSRFVSIRIFGADRQLSVTLRITFRIGAFQPLSITKIMPKKICSNENRKPIRYKNWNRAIAIRYDGNISFLLVFFQMLIK